MSGRSHFPGITTVGIERTTSWIGRWRRRPRFRAPAAVIVLPLLLAAGLLASLAPGPAAPPAPPAPAPRAPDSPKPLPRTAPPTPSPAEPAESNCPHGCPTPPPGCDIKGNISLRTGERIYHVPGGEYYDSTVISSALGEAWFCTEAEARENGWRKSKR
jgi:hypothetical protein